MQIKGKEKTQRPLCHGPLATASYMSWDDILRLLKRFISYLYVCMQIRMHALIYLFIWLHTKNIFWRGQESRPLAPGWMCQSMPGCFRGLEPPADSVSREAVWTLCPLGKLPVENTALSSERSAAVGAGHLWACCAFHYSATPRRAREESHCLVSRCTKTSGLWK